MWVIERLPTPPSGIEYDIATVRMAMEIDSVDVETAAKVAAVQPSAVHLRARAARLDGPTGSPSFHDLATRFESLGDNCEFGILQRLEGAEPLGLLRWA